MKTIVRFLLFVGAVALLGVIIRGINKQAGWFEAHHLELHVDPPLKQEKFRMYMAEPFQWVGADFIRQPLTYQHVLYDTAFVLEYPRVEGENYLVLEYDSAWIFPFVHYKWTKDGQHDYRIILEMEDSVLTANVEIEGPSSEYFYGEFSPMSDSLAYVIHYYGGHGDEAAHKDAEIKENPDTISVARPKADSGDITYEER